MKAITFPLILSIFLLFGATCLLTPKAEANPGCIAFCLYEYQECLAEARVECGGSQDPNCLPVYRTVCQAWHNQCRSQCIGPCPL